VTIIPPNNEENRTRISLSERSSCFFPVELEKVRTMTEIGNNCQFMGWGKISCNENSTNGFAWRWKFFPREMRILKKMKTFKWEDAKKKVLSIHKTLDRRRTKRFTNRRCFKEIKISESDR
jgi:hypothetical protein